MSTKFGSQQKQSPEDNTGGGRTNTSASRYNHISITDLAIAFVLCCHLHLHGRCVHSHYVQTSYGCIPIDIIKLFISINQSVQILKEPHASTREVLGCGVYINNPSRLYPAVNSIFVAACIVSMYKAGIAIIKICIYK